MNNEKSKLFLVIKMAEVFRYIYQEVSGMTYYRNNDTEEEYVRVFLNQGHDFDVCVTADSLPAILKDVSEAINRRLN